MDEKIRRFFESTFQLKENEGQNKVVSLKEAIAQNVRPGMSLHIGEGANAVTRELLRQFHGKDPQFTLIASGVSDCLADLIHCGLVNKVITSNCVDTYPVPSPSRIIQKAYREKNLEIENWSLFSIVQRLMAGAMDVEFMPTKSIIGTDMAEENKDSFKLIEDPFGSGRQIGLVKALNPDLSLIHGWASDGYGNTIIAPTTITGQAAWGALASREGVVVTVEKLVSTDFIRRHARLVELPGYMVKAIAVTPFGAHPYCLPNLRMDEFEAYGADYQFLQEHRQASRDKSTLDEWIKEWILDGEDYQDYLKKLGSSRLIALKGKASEDAWKYNLWSLGGQISTDKEYSNAEAMIVTGARRIKATIAEHQYRTMLVGMGVAGLASWMAYYQLKNENYDLDLILGSGLLGLAPRPGDPQLLINIFNFPTYKMIGDIIDVYGVMVGGKYSRCLSILGAGQIDKFGNINSTKVSGDLYLTGAGGAGDAVNAPEVVVVTAQSARRYLDRVEYISCSGKNVTTVISDWGIFEKLSDGELTLTSYFPRLPSREENIKKIKEICGWELKIAADLKEISPPTEEELIMLRLLDPEGLFTKD
jgi:acyl CoA:acetate/3-ketoacid CoA transferase alpha subunit/acyl CoA:acetate/3-ketoacid CoA transferase beta subunit